MKTRIYIAMLTALLVLSMIGSAMCAPTGLPEQAATQAEQKAIDTLQKAIDAKGYNWTAGVTSVSRLTDDEKKKLCGVKPEKDNDVIEKPPSEKLELVGTYPSTFDWRMHNGSNWVTPVRSQGSCGSCWAFSALGATEAVVNIYANDPNIDIDLSEQHLVSDCYSSGDCEGGQIGDVFSYLRYRTGVPEEACFPYIHENSECVPCDNWESNAWNAIATPTYYQSIWKDYITSYGPMSAVIVVYEDFGSYTGGVYQHVTGDFSGYHAITVVGWNDTEGCWIIKNSWGTSWGEDGYGRLPGSYFPSNYAAYAVTSIGNYVPTAEISANQTSGIAPITVAFTGTGVDYDGTIAAYDWDFGDGASSTSQNPTHTYTDIGMYTAILTVIDDDGSTGFDSVDVINGEIVTPVSASASSHIADGYQAENAIDGDAETYWMSNVLDYPNWIMFDFGEQVTTHSIYASVPGHELSMFDVSVSDDAVSWDVVEEDVSVTSSSTVGVVMNASQSRYVKLTFDDLNAVEGCCEFYAILASTDPRAWESPTAAFRGPVWDTSYPYYNPYDGDLSTGWFTRYENLPYATIKFDMGEVGTYDAIRFAAYEPYTPVNISIGVSYFGITNFPNDPIQPGPFKAMVSGEGYNVIEFDEPLTGRYIHIRETEITVHGSCMEMQASVV